MKRYHSPHEVRTFRNCWNRNRTRLCFLENLASGGRQPPDGVKHQGANAPRSPQRRFSFQTLASSSLTWSHFAPSTALLSQPSQPSSRVA